LLLVSPLLLFAQEGNEYVEVEVYNAKPSSVLVRPGSKKDVVRIFGRGFELVKKVEIQRQSNPCKTVSVKLRVVARGIADLEVLAAPQAEPGLDYRVVMFTPKNSYPVDLDVEVRDPNE
jgi:hypothetical protein